MWDFFQRVRCSCGFCEGSWNIPVRRIRRMERFLGFQKGQPFIRECHDCHEGGVIPGPYTNTYGELMTINPDKLSPDTEVFRF